MATCLHIHAFLQRVEAFNPDDGSAYSVFCPDCDNKELSKDDADNLYKELA